MSSDIAINIENLNKCYLIYNKPRDRLLQMFVRGRHKFFNEFWALKDVSFQVKKGETVGIVGRNGSGKSTLLQIICGTLSASGGHIGTNGRIAALLELGSCFNPEFTGRENVYLNGAMLGLDEEEINSRYDDIVAFADIGQFIDQPVKTYSSGMVIRLAFAVAINVDPQILVVDEALSVGDELFQRKCFSRIEAIKQSGATILFVSHSGATVIELCDRAILLDRGEMLTQGEPKIIIGKYQRLLYAPADKIEGIRQEIREDKPSGAASHSSAAREEDAPQAAPPPPDGDGNGDANGNGNGDDSGLEDFYDPELKPKSTIAYESHGALIESPKILNSAGQQVNHLRKGRTYFVEYKVRFNASVTNVRFGMLIKTHSGIDLGGIVSAPNMMKAVAYMPAGSLVELRFGFTCQLNTGIYFINTGVLGVKNTEETFLHRMLDACLFRVLPGSEDLSTGIVDFNCTLQDMRQVSETRPSE